MLNLNNNIPSLTKYMGSKTEIINYVFRGLNSIHKEGQSLCDLFSGSSTLAGALRNNCVKFVSNDIQNYSSIFSKAYYDIHDWSNYPNSENIIEEVTKVVDSWKIEFEYYWNLFDYNKDLTLEEFNDLELRQQELLNDHDFINKIYSSNNRDIKSNHLFVRYYSGTYFSFRQCVWIDALRLVADRYKDIEGLYSVILSCTMYAMAYNSQSTGHYAQYRKADRDSSKEDILKYRRMDMEGYFIRKYNELKLNINNVKGTLETYSLNYLDCIEILDNGTLVYADPPYCQVHYSRFYHILETFIKYDYPEIKFGGRYRTDRHQSPFCISTKVRGAFKAMFKGLHNKNCELVLSYSNSSTSMIDLKTLCYDAYVIFNDISTDEDLEQLGLFIEKQESMQIKNNLIVDDNSEISININEFFRDNESKYELTLKMFEHIHSTMGRNDEKEKEVLETLLIVKLRSPR